jgi:K+-transporting ATPase KdpF subunit
MTGTIIFVLCYAGGNNGTEGYTTGAVIALFILIYLLFSLIKPRKF